MCPGRTGGRGDVVQVLEHAPKQFLHHIGDAALLGVRKRVARRSCAAADHSKLRGVMPERVADVIEAY